MKHLFFIPILLFLISCGGGDLSGGEKDSIQNTLSKIKGPFFWQAEKDGRVLHILGTIHYGVDLRDLKCHEKIHQSLSQSQLVWTESNENLEQEILPYIQNRVASDFVDFSGQDFRGLNPESQRFFQSRLQEGAFESFNYLGLNFIYTRLCLAQAVSDLGGVLGEIKLDAQVQSAAQSQAIPQAVLDEVADIVEANLTFGFPEELVSKESLERSIKYFDDNCSLDEKDQIIKQSFKSGQLISDIVDQFNSDNWNELKKQGWSEGELKRWENYYNEVVLKRRNETWLKKLVSQKNQSMFVAAGLLHFIGAYSLLDMLKREGFTIKRYSAECVAEESY